MVLLFACKNGISISGKLGSIPLPIDLHGSPLFIMPKYASSNISFGNLQLKTSTITTTFFNCLKPKIMKKTKTGPNMDPGLGLGGMVMQDGFIFRQKFLIRSYEIGPDRNASVETLMNYLQETVYGHLKEIGVVNDGFNFVPETRNNKNLAWVMTKMQMVVNRYPKWGDIVQIDTCIATYGKNAMCCNWMFCDFKTDKILVTGSSIFVMMNKDTRKLSRFPNEVREIVEQYFVDTPCIFVQDTRKWLKQDDNIAEYHVCKRLTPRWSDLDANQHVNNAKYVGLILESVPKPIIEKYEIVGMILDYYQECTKDSVLQSHTSVFTMNDITGEIACYDDVDCRHVLRLENGGAEIMKGRTRWRYKCGVGNSQGLGECYINSSNCCFNYTYSTSFGMN